MTWSFQVVVPWAAVVRLQRLRSFQVVVPWAAVVRLQRLCSFQVVVPWAAVVAVVLWGGSSLELEWQPGCPSCP